MYVELWDVWSCQAWKVLRNRAVDMPDAMLQEVFNHDKHQPVCIVLSITRQELGCMGLHVQHVAYLEVSCPRRFCLKSSQVT